MQYQNPALDIASLWPVAASAGKVAYDFYNTWNPQTLPTRAQKNNQLLKKKRLFSRHWINAMKRVRGSNKVSKRPYKRQRVQAINKFQAPRKGHMKEPRWVDASGTINFNSGVNIALLNGVVTGTDYFQRIGHKFINTSIHFTGHILPNATLAASDTLGYAIVYDRQSNGSPPSWGDVFEGTDSAGTLTSTSLTHFNLQNSDRFHVIAHQTKQMPSLTVTAGVTSALGYVNPMQDTKIEIYKKIQLPTKCDGDTAAIADIVSGSIYLITKGTAATSGWSILYTNRIRIEC